MYPGVEVAIDCYPKLSLLNLLLLFVLPLTFPSSPAIQHG